MVAADWKGGFEAIIRVGVRVYDCLRAFEGNDERTDTFIRALEDLDVLTRNEARLGLHSSQLSKLRSIGEHAMLLRRPEISRVLGPSYPKLYQLTVLFNELPGEEDQKLRSLLEILEPAGDRAFEGVRTEVTREYLARQTAAVKQQKKRAKKSRAPAHPETPGGADDSTLSALIEARAEFDLVAMDVTGRCKLLGDEYAPGYGLEDCLPLYKVMADHRAIVVLAKISDFPAIETKLLPACGFRRRPEVLMPRQPTSPLVTEAEILIAMHEGGEGPDLQALSDWIPGDEPVSVAALAQRLYPAATRRLHAFAEAQVAGWQCLLGEDRTWVKEPSLR